jgi:hypothetical protein
MWAQPHVNSRQIRGECYGDGVGYFLEISSDYFYDHYITIDPHSPITAPEVCDQSHATSRTWLVSEQEDVFLQGLISNP